MTVPGNNVSLDDNPLEQCLPGQKSLGKMSAWVTIPWTNDSMDNHPLEKCHNAQYKCLTVSKAQLPEEMKCLFPSVAPG